MQFEKFKEIPVEEAKKTEHVEIKESIEEEVEKEAEKEISPEEVPHEAKEILSRIKESGFEGYFVGGCVRDLLLEEEPKDWDITTNAKPEEIQEIFPRCFYENKFGTVTAITESEDPTLKTIEITPYRLEGKYTDKRHPDEIKFADNLDEDLKRRDFTINAMAATLREEKVEIVDLFNGREDLKNKLIRTAGDPKERFQEDALRLMRAPRFAVQLGFKIEPETGQAIKENAPLLEIIAKERIRDEFSKIMETSEAVRGIGLLNSLNLLEQISPELKERIREGEVSFSSLERAAKQNFNLSVRFSAFFRDVAKAKEFGVVEIRKTLRELKFPKEFGEKVANLFENSNFLEDKKEFSKFDARCLWRKVTKGEEINEKAKKDMEDLVNLRLSEIEKKSKLKGLEKIKELLEKVSKDPISRHQLEIDGKEIMETLNIDPGPKIGNFLNILLFEVIKKPEKNEKEYLISRLKELNQLDEKKLNKLGKLAKEKIG